MTISDKNPPQYRSAHFDFDSLREIAKNQIESLYARKKLYPDKNIHYLKEIKKVIAYELKHTTKMEGRK